MPFLFLIGLISAVAIWWWRIRMMGDAARDLTDAANDVRLAARRFNYRRKRDVHPADAVDDARVAAMGVVLGITGMERMVDRSDIDAASIQAQSVFGADKAEATEIVALARWVVDQCRSRDEALRRLSRRIRDLAGPDAAADLDRMTRSVAGALSEDAEDQLAASLRTVRGV